MSRLQNLWRTSIRSAPALLLLGLLLVALLPAAGSSAQVSPGAGDGPAAPNVPAILVLTDDPVHRPPETYVDIALKNLGLPYAPVYDDMAKFEEDLLGQKWDLVIMANDQLEPTKSIFVNLDKYVKEGGRLIVHTWVMAEVADEPLWETLGVRWTETNDLAPGADAAPIYWWDRDHPVFNDPNAKVPMFLEMSNTWEKRWPVEHAVDFGKSGEPLGGFREDQIEGAAALVLGNYGVTAFRGFVDFINEADLDEDKTPDAVELWENLITFVLRVDARPGSFSKISPTNNATGVPFDALLNWASSARVDNYRYCIDEINNAACDDSWRSTGSSSAIVNGLKPNTAYYWQVRAENPYGTTYANGSAGAWWKFTTGDKPPDLVYLPAVLKDHCSSYPGRREIESNDSFSIANGPICFGPSILGDPDEHGTGLDQDWFKIYWSGQGTIKVDVVDYLQEAQVLLYFQSDTSTELDRDYNQVDRHYEIAYPGTGQAGFYFIRLYAPDPHPVGNGDYTLLVTIQ